MSIPGTVLIQCDWVNIEGRLTAHFSGDKRLQERLDAELVGGPKVHSIHASLLYGCDPADAKKHMITLKGQSVPAYDGGKRMGHAWNYGMSEREMSEQFWITRAEARRVHGILSNEYPDVVEWRLRLSDYVFGVALYQCPRCGWTQRGVSGVCPECKIRHMPVNLRYMGYEAPPTRKMRTPFGAHRYYLGRRKDGANALAAQLPQSTGSSIWNRTLCRLHGFYVAGGHVETWPAPEDTLVWSPGFSHEALTSREWKIRVVTGTYDSFLIRAPEEREEEVRTWALWTMEQPWSELKMLRFPADPSRGLNWYELEDVPYQPLTARYPS